MRTYLTFLLIGLLIPSVGFSSEILKVKKNGKYALVSQNEDNAWERGDRVCAMEEDEEIACGVVKKAKRKAALVRFKGGGADLRKGLSIVPAGNGGVLSEAGRESSSKKFSRAQISAELLGTGFWGSLMGSYRFTKNLAFNLGFSYISLSVSSLSGSSTTGSTSVLQIPFSVSYLLGSGNNFLEALVGADLAFASTELNTGGLTGAFGKGGLMPQFGLGYRFWRLRGGFHFRATGYVFLVSLPTLESNGVTYSTTNTSTSILPWLGVTFGYAF